MKAEPKRVRPHHRLAYIDALRGVAFLGVVSHHCAGQMGSFPRQLIFNAGYLGVPLFFILSAVTLFSTYTERQGTERHPVGSFYLRRLFRIAPLYWLALVGYNLLVVWLPGFYFPSPTPPDLLQPVYVALNALFLNGLNWSAFHSVVPGGWSIAMEMLFYAVFPLCFAWVTNVRRAAVVAAIACLLAGFIQTYPTAATVAARYNWPFTPPAQMFVFPVGVLVYFLIRQPELHQRMIPRFWPVMLLIGGGAALVSFTSASTAFFPVYLWQVAALAALVMAFSGGAFNFLLVRPLLYCGRISFSGYLLHFVLIGVALKLLAVHLGPQRPEWDAGSSPANLKHFAALIGATLALTIPAASLTEMFIERPGIALGKRLVRRLNRTPA